VLPADRGQPRVAFHKLCRGGARRECSGAEAMSETIKRVLVVGALLCAAVVAGRFWGVASGQRTVEYWERQADVAQRALDNALEQNRRAEAAIDRALATGRRVEERATAIADGTAGDIELITEIGRLFAQYTDLVRQLQSDYYGGD